MKKLCYISMVLVSLPTVSRCATLIFTASKNVTIQDLQDVTRLIETFKDDRSMRYFVGDHQFVMNNNNETNNEILDSWTFIKRNTSLNVLRGA